MSGIPSSSHGNRGRHFEAARDWLNRAEAQLASGETVMAAATLMLAQAEMRLLSEGVVSGAAAPLREPRSRAFRAVPISRTLVGSVALAACFVIGIALGRVWAPPSGAVSPGALPGGAVQIAQAPTVSPEPQPTLQGPEEAPSIESPQPAGQGNEAVLGVQTPPPPEPSTRTPVRHRPRQPQPAAAEPVTPEPTPAASEEPQPAVEPTPQAQTQSPETEAEGISPAELALRTIRALSERLMSSKESE